jgi:hypothetical protein
MDILSLDATDHWPKADRKCPVCTENLIRIDWGRESPNVSAQ